MGDFDIFRKLLELTYIIHSLSAIHSQMSYMITFIEEHVNHGIMLFKLFKFE